MTKQKGIPGKAEAWAHKNAAFRPLPSNIRAIGVVQWAYTQGFKYPARLTWIHIVCVCVCVSFCVFVCV